MTLYYIILFFVICLCVIYPFVYHHPRRPEKFQCPTVFNNTYCEVPNQIAKSFDINKQSSNQTTVDQASSFCDNQLNCQGFSLYGDNPSTVQYYQDINQLVPTMDKSQKMYIKSQKPCQDTTKTLCLKQNSIPSVITTIELKYFTSMEDMNQQLLQNDSYGSILYVPYPNTINGIYYSFVGIILGPSPSYVTIPSIPWFLLVKQDQPNCLVFDDSTNVSSKLNSPFSLSQLRQWISSVPYIRATDQVNYPNPFYHQEKMIFNTSSRTCNAGGDSNCILNDAMKNIMKLNTNNFIQPNNQYYLDHRFQVWSKQQNQCCTRVPYDPRIKGSSYTCPSNSSSFCNKQCTLKFPTQPFYRKDLQKCVTSYCDSPTTVTCQDETFKKKCPSACKSCSFCKGFEYYTKVGPFIPT